VCQLDLYRTLRERIVTNEYEPGFMLTATTLAEEFGVSATPIREAVVRLEMEGLVQRIPNSSAVVTAPSLRSVQEAMIVRYHLMPLLAAQVVRGIEPSELVKLEEIIADAKRTETLKQAMEVDTRFHELLARSSRNEILGRVLAQLRLTMSRLWVEVMRGDNHAEGSHSGFEASFSAVKNKDENDYEACLTAIKNKNEHALAQLLQNHVVEFVETLNRNLLAGLKTTTEEGVS